MKKILVVDDQPSVRELLAEFLEGEKYSVKVALDGYDALRKIEKSSFDVVITDIRMPGMNGIEFVSELRERNIKTKIITMSGESSCSPELRIEEINNLDSDIFLEKPFDLQNLLKTIEHLLLESK